MSAAKTIGWLLGGVAATPLLDYAWHRLVAHGRRPDPSRVSHLEHHRTAHTTRDPREEVAENAPRVLKTAAVVAGVLTPVVGLGAAVPFAAGLALGYVVVTHSHARMHERAPANAWEEWMWRFHFHHHYANARTNFGLTSPIFDFLFGTAEVPEVVVLPDGALPTWWRGAHRGFRARNAA